MTRPRPLLAAYCLLLSAVVGCGYTTRPGLASTLRTVYIKPFINQIDVTRLSTSDGRFPVYRHRMETDLTNAVINRFQFTGLLRPTPIDRADTRLEGALLDFRRDALRYDASQQVEEWRLTLVVSLRFINQSTGEVLWEESAFAGDATYFALGANAESEAAGLDRALTDLARRIVERTVEDW